MARTNTLSNFLTDIATAIKQKKDDQTDIQASEFDTEILALPAQGVYQHKTVPIAQNGTHTVIPDSGYDAIDELTVNVAVPEKRLQTKNYTFTQNANLQLTPEIGYDGFNQIGLNINVPTGTGGVKLFTSEQAMQADTDPHVGDMAIVYNSVLAGVTVNSTFDYFILPMTVTLTEEMTSTAYAEFRAVDPEEYLEIYLYVSANSATIDVYSAHADYAGSYSYTSSDGITYILDNATSDTPVTLHGEVEYSFGRDLNKINNFIQCYTSNFIGLYNYSDTVTDYDKLQGFGYTDIDLSSWAYDSSYNWVNCSYLLNYADFADIFENMLNDSTVPKSSVIELCMYIKNNKYYVVSGSSTSSFGYIFAHQDDGFLGLCGNATSTSISPSGVKIYELDLTNKTYTLVDTIQSVVKSIPTSSTTTYYIEYVPILPDSMPILFDDNTVSNNTYDFNYNIKSVYKDNDDEYYHYATVGPKSTPNRNPYKSAYVLAPTQFNLTANQALQDTIAYSNKGVVNGTIAKLGSRTITPSTEQQTISAGYTTGVTIKPITYLIDSDIKYNNIKEGVNILGIDGEIPDIEIHYIGDGYQNQVYNGSASNTVNKATMFAYKVGNHGGSISTGIYDKDCNWVGLLSGSNETWSVESDGTLAHKTSITAPNLQFGMWSSVQTDGVITGTWRNNQCRVWYVPYGSGYRRYIRCVTFTKNANGEIVYDSSLPKWQFILPSQPTEATYTELTNAGIIIDPTNEDMVTVSCYAYVSGTNYKNSRILFYSLKLDDYSGSGWGTMTCGDVITSIPTGNNQMMPDACRYFQYRNGNKAIVYGNYGGAYSNQPIQILFTDENGFVKYITTNNTLILAFKNDMSKCITSNRLYNMTVDYINHTVTLGNYISISTNVGRNVIGDRYDNYLFGNSSTSGYPDVYYNKLYRINWETGVITQLLSAGLEYSSNVIQEYPCGNLSTASIFADGSWPTSSYGSFLSIKIPKKIDYMSYNGVNYRPDKPTQTKTITPTTSQQVITPDEGYELASVIIDGVTSDIDSNIQPENIRNGVTILGVEGNYERPDASM